MDLDFFVTPVHKAASSDNDARLPDSHFKADNTEKVLSFMKDFLGLDSLAPVPGRTVTHHREVFFLWEELIAHGKLLPKFSVVHIDAHDDLYGSFKSTAIRSDNYLLHAANRGWLAHLCYIHTEGSDMPADMYLPDPYRELTIGDQAVEFSILDKAQATGPGSKLHLSPSFLFLAKSPAFTPQCADRLIPILEQFISPF